MIALVIFYLHVVGITAVFSKRYQAEGLGEGFLAVFFMGLIFFVGWAMSSFLMKLVMESAGFATWLDRDTASLLLLTIAEAFLYYFYFKEDEAGEPEESHII